MGSSYSKLEQAMIDFFEAFNQQEEEIEDKFGDDADAYQSAMVETLEGAIEAAVDDQDSSSSAFGTMLTFLSEALEQFDPSAFNTSELDDFGDLNSIDDDDDDMDIDDDDDE